jgi:hypothetical protein
VGLRLRTACDFQIASSVSVKRPGNFGLPSLAEIEKALPELVETAAVAGKFMEKKGGRRELVLLHGKKGKEKEVLAETDGASQDEG